MTNTSNILWSTVTVCRTTKKATILNLKLSKPTKQIKLYGRAIYEHKKLSLPILAQKAASMYCPTGVYSWLDIILFLKSIQWGGRRLIYQILRRQSFKKKSTRGQPTECYWYHQAISTGDVCYLDTSCLDIFADHDVCHQKNQQQYKSASLFFNSISAQVLGEAVHMVLRDWGKIKTSIINTLILLIDVYQELKSSFVCSEKKMGVYNRQKVKLEWKCKFQYSLN